MRTAIASVLLAICLISFAHSNNTGAQQSTTLNDKDMRVLEFEDIKYPPLARRTRVQGVVVVQVKLDGDGKVLEAIAISGHDLLLQDSLANAKKWRFQPNAQRSAVIVYHFKMPGVECKTSGSFSTFEVQNLITITGCEVPVS
jgi:TonB family protein